MQCKPEIEQSWGRWMEKDRNITYPHFEDTCKTSGFGHFEFSVHLALPE